MRNVAILSSQAKRLMPDNVSIGAVEIDGLTVMCGVVVTSDIDFDPEEAENRQRVLVKIKAFSCNYRDKEWLFRAAQTQRDNAFFVIGSDFVGEVVSIGAEVRHFAVGDRVIGNNHYTGAFNGSGFLGGIPTNHASREYQVFHPAQLMQIPSHIPDEVAAAFSIGAQTVYSMLRKANLTTGANVLVTSAKSNTSLFVLSALKKYAVNVFATSTSLNFERELIGLGVQRLFQVEPGLRTFQQHPALFQQALALGGFDVVIDPFSDLHLGKVIDVMAAGGRYITCGVWEQHPDYKSRDGQLRGKNLFATVTQAVVRNIQIIGNCLGQTEDLHDAVQDYASGAFEVLIDSVLSGDQVAAFLERTYGAKDRLGKSVYRYT